jgi:hypothetical protein
MLKIILHKKNDINVAKFHRISPWLKTSMGFFQRYSLIIVIHEKIWGEVPRQQLPPGIGRFHGSTFLNIFARYL